MWRGGLEREMRLVENRWVEGGLERQTRLVVNRCVEGTTREENETCRESWCGGKDQRVFQEL